MGRFFNLLIIAVTVTASVLVYALKYDTGRDAAEIERLNRGIADEKGSISVLKAEWSLLNQPDRLQRLAEKYLDLKPLTPAQMAVIGDIPRRPDRNGLRQLVLETLSSTAEFAAAPAIPAPRPKPPR
jgi:cell division protein FtsL